MIRYIDGDLIKMAQNGDFDVIAQGCNCFCVMKTRTKNNGIIAIGNAINI